MFHYVYSGSDNISSKVTTIDLPQDFYFYADTLLIDDINYKIYMTYPRKYDYNEINTNYDAGYATDGIYEYDILDKAFNINPIITNVNGDNRDQAKSFLYNNKIFTFNGRDNINSVEAVPTILEDNLLTLDDGVASFENTSNMNQFSMAFAAAKYENFAYFFGGYYPDASYHYWNKVDLEKQIVYPRQNLPNDLYIQQASATTWKDKILIFGGYQRVGSSGSYGDYNSNNLLILDTKTDSFYEFDTDIYYRILANIPPRVFPIIWVHHNFLYIYGGRNYVSPNDANDIIYNDFYRVDLSELPNPIVEPLDASVYFPYVDSSEQGLYVQYHNSVAYSERLQKAFMHGIKVKKINDYLNWDNNIYPYEWTLHEINMQPFNNLKIYESQQLSNFYNDYKKSSPYVGSIANDGSNIYAFGGKNLDGTYNFKEILKKDLTLDTWSVVGTPTETTLDSKYEISFGTLTYYKDNFNDEYLFLAGGYSYGTGEYIPYIYRYHLNTATTGTTDLFGTFENTNQLYGHDAYIINDTLIIIGGVYEEGSSSYYSNDIYEYDISLFSGSMLQITTKYENILNYRYHAFLSYFDPVDEILYILGGISRDNGTSTNVKDFYKYDRKSGYVKTKLTSPNKDNLFYQGGEGLYFYNGALWYIGARVYNRDTPVAGGYYSPELMKYEISIDKWYTYKTDIPAIEFNCYPESTLIGSELHLFLDNNLKHYKIDLNQVPYVIVAEQELYIDNFKNYINFDLVSNNNYILDTYLALQTIHFITQPIFQSLTNFDLNDIDLSSEFYYIQVVNSDNTFDSLINYDFVETQIDISYPSYAYNQIIDSTHNFDSLINFEEVNFNLDVNVGVQMINSNDTLTLINWSPVPIP